MSWLFSQALVEEFSADTCSDGEPCAQLSVMPTPHKFWRNDKTMDASDLSRFGLTLKLLTGDHGAALLMSYRAASHARMSARPVRALDSTASEADSGLRWQGSFARYNPDTSTWKTAQCSLLADSDEFSETWPRWGSMRNGASYLRPIPALPTFESASGLWQTPVADDAVNRVRGKYNSRGEPKLSAQVLNRPTPRARDSQPEGLEAGRRRVEKYSTCSLSTAVNADAEVSTAGLLNPNWVEWLMGWPIGWTELKPLATGRYQEWLQQHSQPFPVIESEPKA